VAKIRKLQKLKKSLKALRDMKPDILEDLQNFNATRDSIALESVGLFQKSEEERTKMELGMSE
jgi:hypothetical protein